MSDQLPELTSDFPEVLQQIALLIRDIERKRISSVLTIAVVDGKADVRGMGAVVGAPQAHAMLHMATRFMAAFGQPSAKELNSAVTALVKRSEADARDAAVWDGVHAKQVAAG